MSYIRECWYMAAWSEELGAEAMLARTFFDEPVVLFRDAQGSAHALLDQCPHRLAPLSRGVLKAGTVQCIYHGLEFEGSGRCVRNPHGPITVRAQVRSFPLQERDGILWIWPGDPGMADASSVPDLSHMHRVPATAQSRGSMPSACDYRLIVDNVADLSHVEYLHASSLGGGSFVENRPAVTQEGDQVIVELRSRGRPAPPVYDRFLTTPGVPVEFSNKVTWCPVGLLKLDIEVTPIDSPEQGLVTFNAHIVTPESATTSHYWYWLTRSYRQSDTEITRVRHEVMTQVFFDEDKPILEAQQRALGTCDIFDVNPMLLPTDSGTVRIRRVMQRLQEREQAARLERERSAQTPAH
jgi:phenylpropionate dioxygenase-like ring-hydroxylating dioxygenase large terminal subunit